MSDRREFVGSSLLLTLKPAVINRPSAKFNTQSLNSYMLFCFGEILDNSRYNVATAVVTFGHPIGEPMSWQYPNPPNSRSGLRIPLSGRRTLGWGRSGTGLFCYEHRISPEIG